MSLIGKAKRAWHLGQAVTTIAGAGNAAPPAKMPEYLAKQYGHYGQQVRPHELRREVTRLTTKINQPVPALDKRDARRLRGK